MKADLHCHTKMSDNSYTIREVIEQAAAKAVTHLAITDHDTTNGLAEAIAVGTELGVHVIPGIEISGYDFARKKRAHILGLFIEPGHPAILELCDPIVERRHRLSMQMVNRLVAAGFDISWEQVQRYAEGGTGVYKQHIVHALLDAGHTDRIYGELYKRIFARPENGKPAGIAYLPMEYVDAADAIRAIRSAGGVPVLAHPGQFGNFDAIPAWVEAGLEGIEVSHPLHNGEHRRLAQEYASRYGLVATAGSDFHGFYAEDPAVDIGSHTIGEDVIEQLLACKGKRLAGMNGYA